MSVAIPAGRVRRPRFVAVLGGLTAVNVLVSALALVTGPLQARLLGPQGRGELALVLVVCGFAPIVICCGLGSFLSREMSLTRDRGVLLGTVIVVSAALGTLGALFAYPVSRLFSDDHEVQTLILVGFLTLPIVVTGINLHGAYQGEERWRLHSAIRILQPLLMAVGFIVLAVAHAFTVTGAALVVFASGPLALLALWPLIRDTRGWGFDRAVARRGMVFGLKANAAVTLGQGNIRVDQLFIAGMISTRELGFYVVAGTLASATLLVSQALNLIVVPMVAAGDHLAVRRILRVTLALMTVAATALAVFAAPAVHLLFGAQFDDSVVPAQILCFGSIFIAGKGIVSAALVGNGRPGEPALVELATFASLIGALLLVVPAHGTGGAAVVVVVASAAGFAVLSLRTRTWLGGRLVHYLVPTRADAVWVVEAARKRGLRRRGALEPPSS